MNTAYAYQNRYYTKQYLVKFSRTEYLIEEGLGNFSVTPNRHEATVFDTEDEAEDCMRRLWIDGQIVRK